MFTTLSYRDLVQQERARNLREHNQCHTPSGSSSGGQFCSKGGGPGGRFTAAEILDATKAAPAKKPTGRAALSPAAKAAVDRFHTMGIFRSPDDNPYDDAAPARSADAAPARSADARPARSADPRPARGADPRPARDASARPARDASARPARRPKVEYVTPGAGSNPNHIANYRGMEIHTLPGYTTPYYFVNAPGFGSMQHSASLTRIKNQINRFKDTGQTARGHEKAKGSARYQKRKARGY